VCVCVTLCYVDGIIYIYGVQNVKCIGPIRATATSFPHTHTETPTVRFRTTRSFPFNDSARFFPSFFYVIVVFVVSSVSLLLPPPHLSSVSYNGIFCRLVEKEERGAYYDDYLSFAFIYLFFFLFGESHLGVGGR
jgi:hypothetical protein